MKLTKFSERRMKESADVWQVDIDFYDPIHNYLVHGLEPGRFFTAVLANDLLSAMSQCHSANTVAALKALAGWIRDSLPAVAYGSYAQVELWLNMTNEERRYHLALAGLIYTEREEVDQLLREEV